MGTTPTTTTTTTTTTPATTTTTTTTITTTTSTTTTKISSCTASTNQGGYNCSEAFDGVTENGDNGWAYGGGGGHWAIFELETETTINEISLLSGQKRGDHRLISFQLTIKVNNEWFSPTKLSVREDSNAIINSDGKITL